MSTEVTIRDLIARKVGSDRRGLRPEDYVQAAVRMYERFRPRLATFSVDGNGTGSYTIDPTDDPWTFWEPGFSRVVGVEFPVDEDPPRYIDDEDFRVLDADDSGTGSVTRNQRLYLRTVSPSEDDTFRVQHTARHTVNSTLCSIPSADEEAVGDFGASIMLEDIAAYVAGLTSQAGLQIDEVIPYTEVAAEKRAAAKAARRRARVMLGLPADERDDEMPTATACAVLDFDMDLHEGMGGLTHRRGRR